MGFLSIIYTEVLWRPLFNGLIWLYISLPVRDLGLAIIMLTAVTRIVLAPFLWKAQKAQKAMGRIQPEIRKLQEKFKNDREGQGKALMGLYAQHRVNPFSGCLVLLVQFPVLIALFQVFQSGFDTAQFSYLYSFVSRPEGINPISFGIFDLSLGDWRLGIAAGLTQYVQAYLSMSTKPSETPAGFAKMLQTQSLYVFPVLVFAWSFIFPSALTLYWTAMNVFGIVQELVAARLRRREDIRSVAPERSAQAM